MTCAKLKLVFGIIAAIMLASGATTLVFSDDATGEELSSGDIFKKAQENYASMASYSDQGKVVASLNGSTTVTSFAMRLARTNFYRIEWQQASDSSAITNDTRVQAAWSSGSGDFLEMGNGPEKQEGRRVTLARATDLSGGAAGTIPRTFFNMQWGDQLGGSVFNQSRQADEKVSDVNCYVFTRESQGRTKTLWIGKQDFLIHQIRTEISDEAMQVMYSKAAKGCPEMIALLQKSWPNGFTVTETHFNIAVNQPFVRSDFIPSNGE
jgi:hypothetical protein